MKRTLPQTLRIYLSLGLIFLAGIPIVLLILMSLSLYSDMWRDWVTTQSWLVVTLLSMAVGWGFIWRGRYLGQKQNHGPCATDEKQREVEVLGRSLQEVIERIQEKVFFAEKMAAVGEMAAGLAHEMNNILMPIRGYAAMLEKSVTQEDQKKIAIIKENVEHGVALIKNMMSFAKANPDDFEDVSLPEILRSVLELLKLQIDKNNITVSIRNHARETIIHGNESQLKQVFVNLMINAIHAVGSGGGIDIECVSQENHLCVKIKDNGCGIAKEDLQEIFKPFVTRREGGVGLGLSVTYSIIKAHNGDIDVKSDVGVGTEFCVKFLEAVTSDQ